MMVVDWWKADQPCGVISVMVGRTEDRARVENLLSLAN